MSSVAQDGITLRCDLCGIPCFDGESVCESCMKGGMSNQQILERAIQKAIDGGWDGDTRDHIGVHAETFQEGMISGISIEEVIFSHDFAKALFGFHQQNIYDIGVCTKCGMKLEGERYGLEDYCAYSHLQEMAIADDPIKYLGQNI